MLSVKHIGIRIMYLLIYDSLIVLLILTKVKKICYVCFVVNGYDCYQLICIYPVKLFNLSWVSIGIMR